MVIEIRNMNVETRKTYQIELDINFLNTGYYRRVFKIKPGSTIKIPHRPHYHEGKQVMVLVDGQARLAYKDGGQVEILPLESGKWYRLDDYVAHQLEISGIVELYYPTPMVLAPSTLLDEELF